MDSFEASTQFSQMLKALTPSIQNLTRAAHFALKNHEKEDYLFPVIIEVLDDSKVELNTKSSIFQFIEVLMHEAFAVLQQPKSPYSYPYIHTLKSLLPQILLKVLPGTNNASLHTVYSSLKNICKTCKVNIDEYDDRYNRIQTLFTANDLKNVDANIPFPEIELDELVGGGGASDPLITTWELLIEKKKQSQYERLRLLKHLAVIQEPVAEEQLFSFKGPRNSDEDGGGEADELQFSKKQILSRMEDDRESHKRSKESLWLVNRPKDTNVLSEDEFLVHYWNKFGNVTDEEDKTFMNSLDELNKLVAQSYKDKQF